MKVAKNAEHFRKYVRYTFDIHFTSPKEREAFHHQLNSVCKCLIASGCLSLDNCSLKNAMFDIIKGESTGIIPDNPLPDGSQLITKIFMKNGGELTKYT